MLWDVILSLQCYHDNHHHAATITNTTFGSCVKTSKAEHNITQLINVLFFSLCIPDIGSNHFVINTTPMPIWLTHSQLQLIIQKFLLPHETKDEENDCQNGTYVY